MTTQVEPQAREIIRTLFLQVKNTYRQFEQYVNANMPLLQSDDYQDFNNSRNHVNDYINTIEDRLKDEKYIEAATDIERLQNELGTITGIIQRQLNTIGKDLILAKPQD